MVSLCPFPFPKHYLWRIPSGWRLVAGPMGELWCSWREGSRRRRTTASSASVVCPRRSRGSSSPRDPRAGCGLTQRVGRPGAGPDKGTARQQEPDKGTARQPERLRSDPTGWTGAGPDKGTARQALRSDPTPTGWTTAGAVAAGAPGPMTSSGRVL